MFFHFTCSLPLGSAALHTHTVRGGNGVDVAANLLMRDKPMAKSALGVDFILCISNVAGPLRVTCCELATCERSLQGVVFF